MIGETISHYKILEKLGEGGMGVVYKALDTKLDRFVALKFLPEHLSVGSGELERFIQEAKAAAALNHPNICTIYGIEEADGRHFIAMEFVDGQTLQVKKSSLSQKQAMEISVQVAEGLAAAHEKGIVHRDIKPENIMIRKDGIAQITDFGLAKLRGVSRLTKEGSTVGTAGYMSPEQVQGQDVDYRSDIFSLGVMIYELLSDRSPFKGAHETAIIYEIVNVDAPPLSSIRPETEPELNRLVMECLEKDPKDRCQSAAELARNLRRFKRESSKSRVVSQVQTAAPALEAGKRGFRRLPTLWKGVIAALSACSALGIGALVLLLPPGRDTLDLSAYRYTPFETDGRVSIGAWSPDGKTVAYVRAVQGFNQIMVRALENPRSTLLAAIETPGTIGTGISNLFWSHDGQRLFFISGLKLHSIGLAGGEPKAAIPYVGVRAAAASPDNSVLLFWIRASRIDSTFGDSTAVFVSTTEGGAPRRYLPDPFKLHEDYNPVFMKFSPDGSRVGLTFYTLAGVEFWILPWPDGPDSRPRKVFEQRRFASPPYFEWLPDSRTMVLSIDDGMWVGDTEEGTLRRITSSQQGEYLRSVSPDGKRILYQVSSTNYDIVMLPLDGSPLRPFIATSVNEYSATVSQEGKSMAFITARSGRDEIWFEGSEGMGHPIVTAANFAAGDSGRFHAVFISPDGRRVAYWRDGQQRLRELWISNAEGGKPVSMFGESDFWRNTCWSPDGRRLFLSMRRGDSLISVIAPLGLGGEKTVLPKSAWSVCAPVWSPDGQWIALGKPKDSEGTNRIELISPDGKQLRVLPSPVIPDAWSFSMAWSRDSKTIYVASSVEKVSRLDAIDVQTGRSRKIAEYGSDVVFGYHVSQCSVGSISRDGKGLLVSARFPQNNLYILDGAL